MVIHPKLGPRSKKNMASDEAHLIYTCEHLTFQFTVNQSCSTTLSTQTFSTTTAHDCAYVNDAAMHYSLSLLLAVIGVTFVFGILQVATSLNRQSTPRLLHYTILTVL